MDKHSLHTSRSPHVSRPPTVEQLAPKPPSIFRNYISLVGLAIVIASLVSVILLFLLEITSNAENPYLGILTYIIGPSVLMFGVAVVVAGMLIERRRRRRAAPSEIAAYPKLDLNDPHSRRAFFTFLLITFVFVSASAFGSYRGFEYTESVNFCGETCHTVMKPEFTAYKAGAHARVGCVGCHVGPGASWYVRSKLSGAYQLYSVTFKKNSRHQPARRYQPRGRGEERGKLSLGQEIFSPPKKKTPTTEGQDKQTP